MPQWKVWLLVWLSPMVLFGCGDASVYICIGDPRFCASALNPIADAGPDQTAAAGDLVTLDGSDSQATSGTIEAYSWTQTGGLPVALSNANQAIATFIAPNVTSSTSLSFRLTVINSADRGDIATTLVTVLPSAAAAP